MRNGIYLFAFSLLIMSACKPTKIDTWDRNAAKKDIRQMLHDYHQEVEEKGLLAEFEYLDSSAQFFWVPPGFSSALDYDSVKTILTNYAPLYQKIHFTWEELSINPLHSGIVTYYGKVNSTMTDTLGITTESTLLESGTLIKRMDGWKLLSGQSVALPIKSSD